MDKSHSIAWYALVRTYNFNSIETPTYDQKANKLHLHRAIAIISRLQIFLRITWREKKTNNSTDCRHTKISKWIGSLRRTRNIIDNVATNGNNKSIDCMFIWTFFVFVSFHFFQIQLARSYLKVKDFYNHYPLRSELLQSDSTELSTAFHIQNIPQG